MQPSIRTILATTGIFDNFSDDQLTMVAALSTPVTYGQGHILLTENEQSDDLYIIGRGGVEVLVNPAAVSTLANQDHISPVVLTELRQGQEDEHQRREHEGELDEALTARAVRARGGRNVTRARGSAD